MLCPPVASRLRKVSAPQTVPDVPLGRKHVVIAPDFGRLSRAARDLDADAQDLVQQFVEANEITPNFTEFEALVTELDGVTAETCGFPIISAWGSITEALGQLPCWIETGVPYPAFEQADCD